MCSDLRQAWIFITLIVAGLVFNSCLSSESKNQDRILDKQLDERISELKARAMKDCFNGIVEAANLHVDTMMPVWYTDMIASDSIFPSRPMRPQENDSLDSLALDTTDVKPLFNLIPEPDSSGNIQ